MEKNNLILRFKTLIYSFFALLTGILTVASISAQGLCKTVGTGGMESKNKAPVMENSGYATRELGSRKYTIMELFGNSYYPSVPYGEWDKGENWFMGENKSVSSKETLDNNQKERIEARGKENNIVSCTVSGLPPFFQAMSTGIVESITGFIRVILLMFFDSNIICGDTKTFGCIDLLGIAGGKTDSDGGLIKQLGNGIFMPLVVGAFLTTACYMIYTGLYKHEYRTSLGGLLWALFSFVLGILTIVKPTLVARAPYKLTKEISACLLNTLAGGDCLSTGSMKDLDDQTCTAYTDGAASSEEEIQLSLSAIGCKITKGFTIDRWARQQFGYDFNELYTKKAPSGYSVYPSSKLQGSPDDYCINMYSTQSPKEMFSLNSTTTTRGSGIRAEEMTVAMDSANIKTNDTVQVCNIALAYMAATTSGQYNAPTIEKITATAAKDEAMWNAYTGHGRDLLGWSQIIGIIGVAISIIPISITGIAYNIIATVMMIFAPVFLLFSIHPDRGRKIFLGWLETVISYILKYFAIGILLIIMVAVYQAAFANTSGFMTLIVPLVLATVFSLYRKEIVNLIGSVSLGGAKMKNVAAEKLDKVSQSAKRKATAVAGGYVGGHMAAKSEDGMYEGETPEERAERYRQAKKDGVKNALGMEMRRGRGFIANATRAGQQTKRALKQEREKQAERNRQDLAREQMLFAQQNALSQMGQNINESIMSTNIDNIRSQANDIYSSGNVNAAVQEAINKSVNKVENAKDLEESKVVTQEARMEINESNRFNHILQNTSSSRADKAVDDYKSATFDRYDNQITEKALEIKEFMLQRGVGEKDAEARAQMFTDNMIKSQENYRKQFDEAVKVADAGRGRTIVKEFNVEDVLRIKKEHGEEIMREFDTIIQSEEQE